VLILKKLELKNFELLFNLMLLGAKDRFITVKTSELAEILGKSQQSASVYLSKLEKEGYIQRTVGKRRNQREAHTERSGPACNRIPAAEERARRSPYDD
jgi:Bacterial regulatory protein, arsR family.